MPFCHFCWSAFRLGSWAFKAQCLWILVLPRNLECGTQGWYSFGRGNQGVHLMAGYLCGSWAPAWQGVEGNHGISNLHANILFVCVVRVHLFNKWGLAFCLVFGTIGSFLHGWFPSSVSIISFTTMLKPGLLLPMVSVCKSLGFFEGNFILIRRSNECPNTQFTVQFLTHGLNSDKVPDILPHLASGHKTIIHCRTVNQVTQVYAYI